MYSLGKGTAILYLLPMLLFFFSLAGCESDEDEVEPDHPETVTDVDGNVYDVISIGDRAWMAENLRTTRYRNGDPMETDMDAGQWMATLTGAYAIYPHDDVDGIHSEDEMVDAYGKLYNWYAVDGISGLCPEGWRVPTEQELIELTDYIRDHVQEDHLANVLKSCRQVDSPLGGDCDTEEHPRWDEHETHYGTDDLGFSALPAGNRTSHNASFEGIGHWYTLWSSTESGGDQAIQRWMRSNSGAFFDLDPDAMHAGKSVRCIWVGD